MDILNVSTFSTPQISYCKPGGGTFCSEQITDLKNIEALVEHQTNEWTRTNPNLKKLTKRLINND